MKLRKVAMRASRDQSATADAMTHDRVDRVSISKTAKPGREPIAAWVAVRVATPAISRSSAVPRTVVDRSEAFTMARVARDLKNKPFEPIQFTILAHSMGAYVANGLLHAFGKRTAAGKRKFDFRNIVFMSAA